LLLLPGFDGTGELFAPLQSALGENADTAVVRYKNEVTLEDYIETVASLLMEMDGETVLVAESFSGPIALSILARYPERVKAAVLCATFAVSPFRLGASLVSLLPNSVHSLDPIKALFLKIMCLDKEPDLGLLHDALSAIRSVPASTIKSRMKVLASVDVRSLLSQVTTPVLYLQAMQDRLVGTQLSRQLISGLENVSVRQIGGPHMLLQSRPHECAEAILEFIE
jgi:pimeloyl-ACP methyl ester carboxylesterase